MLLENSADGEESEHRGPIGLVRGLLPASANDNLFKVAKGTGSTNWHSHDDQDETFLLLSGELTVQLRDGDVVLHPGDLLVVPRGVEHCPRTDGEARFLLVGPEITSTEAGGKPAWSHRSGTPMPAAEASPTSARTHPAS